MAVKHAEVTVTTTAANIVAGVPDTSGQYEVSRTVVLQNESEVDVFLGGTGVTTTAYGYKLVPDAEASFDLSFDDFLFAVVATGTATVRALHIGV